MTTLIASLGQSPSVITETLDHLRDNGTNKGEKIIFDRLVIIAPGKLLLAQSMRDNDFLQSCRDLAFLEDVNDQYPAEVLWNNDLKELSDIRTEKDAKAFFDAVIHETLNYCYNEDVYYAIAGGRKSMSALMVLAAQIVSVKGIFHILLNDEKLIRNKMVKKLRSKADFLTEHLLKLADKADGSPISDPNLRSAFHPGNTTLIEVPYLSSFTEGIRREIASELCKPGKIGTFSDMSKLIYNYAMETAPDRDDSLKVPNFANDKFLKKIVDGRDDQLKVASVLAELWAEKKIIKSAKITAPMIGAWIAVRYAGDKLTTRDGFYQMNLYIPISERLSVSYRFITTATTEKQAFYCHHQIERYFEEKRLASQKKRTGVQKKVLISTLAESPGVVTAAVHFYEKLRQPPVRFSKIIAVIPNNDVLKDNSAGILKQLLDSKRFSVRNFSADDIRKPDDLEAFLTTMKNVVQEYVNEGYEIYMNLAGGRKVMSGTLLLLAQLYPVKEAFHLSILDDELSQDIEEHGHYERLGILEHEDHGKYQRILFPNKQDVEVLVLPIDKCPYLQD